MFLFLFVKTFCIKVAVTSHHSVSNVSFPAHSIPQLRSINKLDVCESVHHSTIHKEIPTRCKNVSKFYYSIFI